MSLIVGGGDAPQNQQPAECCANCKFSTVQQLPPPNIAKVRQCKRLPPVAILLPQPNGSVALTAHFPIVADSLHCFEFEAFTR